MIANNKLVGVRFVPTTFPELSTFVTSINCVDAEAIGANVLRGEFVAEFVTLLENW